MDRLFVDLLVPLLALGIVIFGSIRLYARRHPEDPPGADPEPDPVAADDA